ncbi:unnamed protein product [Orchesella dallaii]|uniref:Uncharacterized protein n=1 Tax=Orchesella dallaii TaxID=48710 RepID=A0ABP1RUU4_9HEXA
MALPPRCQHWHCSNFIGMVCPVLCLYQNVSSGAATNVPVLAMYWGFRYGIPIVEPMFSSALPSETHLSKFPVPVSVSQSEPKASSRESSGQVSMRPDPETGPKVKRRRIKGHEEYCEYNMGFCISASI